MARQNGEEQSLLLLVLLLCGQSGLDTLPSLHEGLPLGDLARVVGQHARYVRTQKQHRISTHLWVIQGFEQHVNQ